MYLKRLTISNYKSFYEPTTFNFEPGFNVLLGANSSGKTSVLEAIIFHELANTPHRSILNVTNIDVTLTDAPTSKLCFSVDVHELRKMALPAPAFFIGVGDSTGQFRTQDLELVKKRLTEQSLMLDVMSNPSTGQFMRLSFIDWPSQWRSLHNSAQFAGLQIRTTDGEATSLTNFQVGTGELPNLWQKICPKLYRFSAERSVQPISGHHANGELLSSGANLAYCIAQLHLNSPDLFSDLNKLLHRVFPTIFWVGASPTLNSQFELMVHTNPSTMNRRDLAVSINKVGTGVGNALAMLYVALTAQTQRFILLEEPNSFLHPRALRELLAILAEIGSKHQFFVTTHSSDVLRTINASTVTLLEHDGRQTTIKQTSGKALHKFHAGLVDLGIRITDLHGCDKVLWVEGETEEAIVPLLLKHFFPELAQGIAVLPLHATGDFEAKKYEPKKVAEIYKKLSEGSFLAPPMVAIALDKERRSDSEIKQIEKDCAGIVHFLPRTMLEDYLLDVDGITAVLNQELEDQVLRTDVEQALAAAKTSASYLLHPQNKSSKTIHAAKVLKAVFDAVGKLEYRKTAHGPKIAEWILFNKPDDLREFEDWFARFLR